MPVLETRLRLANLTPAIRSASTPLSPIKLPQTPYSGLSFPSWTNASTCYDREHWWLDSSICLWWSWSTYSHHRGADRQRPKASESASDDHPAQGNKHIANHPARAYFWAGRTRSERCFIGEGKHPILQDSWRGRESAGRCMNSSTRRSADHRNRTSTDR